MQERTRWTIASAELTVVQGDLTRMDVDGVVNAANSRLAGGGGVDGAIHRAAGHDRLQAACRAIIAEIGSLPAGRAVITPGFDLPARHVIHTVGPVWRGGHADEAEQLASAYRTTLELAAEHGLETIAFPAISCGAYGYPVELAAPLAVAELVHGLERGLVREARMVLHSAKSYTTWVAAAEHLLARQPEA